MTSPTPSKKRLTFPQAIEKIIEGKKITRVSWNAVDYGVLEDTFLTIYRNGTPHRWLVNDGDLLATDWVVVKDTN